MQIAQANMAATAGTKAGTAAPGTTLEQVFTDHKEMVFRVAYRITGNASDAEDVLQAVFLRLLRQTQPAEIVSMKAYLHRSAVNAALDLLRLRKDAHSVSLEEDGSSAASAGGQESSELREWLRLALAGINPRWAEMFVLRFVEGYSNGEIARMMNTSAAVVAVLLHRTRTQLKKDYLAAARGRR
jgi:RNA polymerase sigma-70 factor (ECF subfamily)